MLEAVVVTLLLVSIVTVVWIRWKFRGIEKYLEQNYKTVKRRQLIEKRRG